MTLGDVPIGTAVIVTRVGGESAFRRRLMELGVLPGTRVELVRVAPLGDPLELRVRGCALSLRRDEARTITVDRVPAEVPIRPTAEAAEAVGIAPSVPAAP
jgi:Fe2+ transport system protein FeoA